MTLYKVRITNGDGTITHSLPYVIAEDGVTVVPLSMDPNESPPTGRAYVLEDDGVTRTYLDWIFAAYSMDLTTLTRVKTSLGGISSSAYDTLLSQIITDVSARFERYMRRQVYQTTVTKTFPLSQLSTVITLDAAPVTSITSIKYASHPSDFAATTAMDTDNYVLEDSAAGHVRFLVQTPLNDRRRPGYVQIVYVGGMAASVGDFIAAYPDITRAADVQCGYEFQRRNTPGGNVTTEAGSTAFDSALGILDSSKAVLDSYRRYLSLA